MGAKNAKQHTLHNHMDSDQKIENQTELLQAENESGQEYSKKTYHTEEFYLKEQDVQALAYDDFLKTKFVNNIEYLGSGYNFVYGYPATTKGIDPGYRRYNAFKFEYEKEPLDSLTVDGDYFVPKSVNLKSKTSCDISFSSQEISSSSDVQTSINVSANLDLKLWGAGISANLEYNQDNQEAKSSDETSIISTAKCVVHFVSLSRYNPPKWSQDLVVALKAILESKKDEVIYEFFEEFGTHVTVDVELGSKFGYVFRAKTKELEKMKSSKLSVGAALEYGGFAAKGKYEKSEKSKEAFKSALSNYRQYSIGAPPDEDNDATKWATQSISSPMPIKGTFITWDDFVKDYSNRKDIPFKENEIKELSQLFIRASQTYCTQYLLVKGIVNQCAAGKNFSIFGKSSNLPQFSSPTQKGDTIGAEKNYKWEKVDSLKQFKIQDFAIDETGVMFVIVIEGNGGTRLYWKQPHENNFIELDTTTIRGKGRIQMLNVSASNQAILLTSEDRGGKKLIFSRNYSKNSQWNVLDNLFGYQSVQLDSNGVVIGIDKNNKLCVQFDVSATKNSCGDVNEDTFDVAEGTVSGSSSRIYKYSPNGITKTIDSKKPAKNVCVTQAGWGYKIVDSDLFFSQNAAFVGSSEKIKRDFVFEKIYCESTVKGPLVVGISNYKQLYYRIPE